MTGPFDAPVPEPQATGSRAPQGAGSHAPQNSGSHSPQSTGFYGGYPHPQPELWLEPGPQLPRRTWQRKSRRPVIAVTVIASLLFAAIAVGAIGWGVFTPKYFTATGAMPADCSTEQAEVDGATVGIGTDVRIFHQTGGTAATSTFDDFRRSNSDCFLVFTTRTQTAAGGDYLVEVGDGLVRQTASAQTLQLGIMLRP